MTVYFILLVQMQKGGHLGIFKRPRRPNYVSLKMRT